MVCTSALMPTAASCPSVLGSEPTLSSSSPTDSQASMRSGIVFSMLRTVTSWLISSTDTASNSRSSLSSSGSGAGSMRAYGRESAAEANR